MSHFCIYEFSPLKRATNVTYICFKPHKTNLDLKILSFKNCNFPQDTMKYFLGWFSKAENDESGLQIFDASETENSLPKKIDM